MMLRNVAVRLNFGEEEWALCPEGVGYLRDARLKHIVSGPPPPPAKAACEAIMLVGLPGCGKSTWAEQLSAKHPHQRYGVLGMDLVLRQMHMLPMEVKRRELGASWALIQAWPQPQPRP